MFYKILMLKPRFYYIKWLQIPKPDSPQLESFFIELTAILDSETYPVFFLSDLRSGHLKNVRHLQRLVRVLDHKHYGGGTSFSENLMTTFDVKMFTYLRKHLAHQYHPTTAEKIKQRSEIFEKPEDAIAHIESLEPGITDDIDWEEILTGAIFSQ